MKDYLRDAADKYYKDDEENKDIASHSMIRILATYHKESLYKLMRETQFTEDDIEVVHRKYNVRKYDINDKDDENGYNRTQKRWIRNGRKTRRRRLHGRTRVSATTSQTPTMSITRRSESRTTSQEEMYKMHYDSHRRKGYETQEQLKSAMMPPEYTSITMPT
eukprot:6454769-Amphidinium_carterae.1